VLESMELQLAMDALFSGILSAGSWSCDLVGVDAEKRLQSKSRQLTSTHYTLLRIQVNILVVYYCWIVESADLQVPIVNDFFLDLFSRYGSVGAW